MRRHQNQKWNLQAGQSIRIFLSIRPSIQPPKHVPQASYTPTHTSDCGYAYDRTRGRSGAAGNYVNLLLVYVLNRSVFTFTARLILGLTNGNMPALRTTVNEVCGREHVVVGMIYFSSEWFYKIKVQSNASTSLPLKESTRDH